MVSVVVTSFHRCSRSTEAVIEVTVIVLATISCFTPVAKKRSSKPVFAKYAAVVPLGMGAYQAHNYTTSYVREKGHQAARSSTPSNYQISYSLNRQARILYQPVHL